MSNGKLVYTPLSVYVYRELLYSNKTEKREYNQWNIPGEGDKITTV